MIIVAAAAGHYGGRAARFERADWGVKERVLRLLVMVGPAEIGGGWAKLLLLLLGPRAVVRIWMLKGRFVGLGCWFCW